ncbi:hypothetical protein [uncultured Imperialibacter sp.]|uniref:hypothetical protein n=1 Tax=uncultured Imperialibacter sp. TaxID=1672639 RepID=UPI0030DA6DA3|tara:strand:- start:56459 stop:56821 length:363 start_codon:yes stop_codon:yes gene_type:complete
MSRSELQQTAKISPELLDYLIRREFPDDIMLVVSRLELLNSENDAGRRRISAAVLKLANRDFNELDLLIDKANFDFRDVISAAEYPRNSAHGFDEQTDEMEKSQYRADLEDYSSWLDKTE